MLTNFQALTLLLYCYIVTFFIFFLFPSTLFVTSSQKRHLKNSPIYRGCDVCDICDVFYKEMLSKNRFEIEKTLPVLDVFNCTVLSGSIT